MERLCVLETGYIVKAVLTCVIRHVQTDTPVDTEHEITEIVAEAHTGAECHLLKQVLHLEVAPGAALRAGVAETGFSLKEEHVVLTGICKKCQK